jgi:flagellar biosynthetic protein FliO
MGASGADLPGFAGSFALSLLSLGLVCLAAYLAVRWLTRRAGRSDGAIRVLGRCPLEPRRSVYLLEVGGRCFLVGVGDGPMSLLAELDRAALPAVTPGRTGAPFADILGKLLRRGGR